MRILFVCTGNISRSAMAELMAPHIFKDPSLQFASAGTRGLHDHAISNETGTLLRHDGIDQAAIDAFRSRRISPAIARESDLILCFEHAQRSDIATENPLKARRTFLMTDFANLCELCARNGWLEGADFTARVESAIANVGLARPELPQAQDIDDPQGQGMEAFITAHNELVRMLKRIQQALG